jgi:sucrose-6-phosphate hydrolase SacC (GH32 family)
VTIHGEEQTAVFHGATDKKLKIDTRKSSLAEGRKSIEAGSFELKSQESLRLQVFIDKSVVEVFANDRQAVMRRIYPTRIVASRGDYCRTTTLIQAPGVKHLQSYEAGSTTVNCLLQCPPS